jgi:3-phenylpropionate/cinnamic acid dioxygenase small subunit
MAWAEDPPSRTRQLIGDLEAAPLANGKVAAKTASLICRSTWKRIISSSPVAARTCCAR